MVETGTPKKATNLCSNFLAHKKLGGGFKYFWVSSLPGEMIPFWLRFFKWVETTNQKPMEKKNTTLRNAGPSHRGIFDSVERTSWIDWIHQELEIPLSTWSKFFLAAIFVSFMAWGINHQLGKTSVALELIVFFRGDRGVFLTKVSKCTWNHGVFSIAVRKLNIFEDIVSIYP